MKNALKFFSKKDLLKINKFAGEELRQQIDKVADVLLNQSILNIGQCKYRICEIEFYIFANEYKDPYTHKNPQQLIFGQWYFHQIFTRTEYRFKGGKYKGLDLTLGDEKNHIGVLIRSIESIESLVRIDGPSLVVDQILEYYNENNIQDLLDHNNEEFLQITFDTTIASKKYISGPRIGLSPKIKNDVVVDSLPFLFSDFRYIVDVPKSKIRKNLLFLHQFQMHGLNIAKEMTGIRNSEAEKYQNWFNQGKQQDIERLEFGDTIESQCIYFGAFEAASNIEKIEVTPEELLKMAIRAFQDGDSDELKYLSSLGIDYCKTSKLGLEFFKLRGISNAMMDEHLLAQLDFLTVLEIQPNDELALANYVTSCLESDDPISALSAMTSFYASMNGLSKGIILNSVKEAIKSDQLKLEDLPEFVINEFSDYLKIKPAS